MEEEIVGRFYNINGKEYVRVSTVLNIIAKPYLTAWQVKLGKEESDKISKEATDIGKQVHKTLENLIKRELGQTKNLAFLKLNAEEQRIVSNAIKSYEKWQRKTKFKPLATEVTVHSDFYNYAGTLDCVGTIKDELVIIDWKTSKRINKEHYLQICAYQNAYWEQFGKVATQMYIFRFAKIPKGKGEIVKIDNADSVKYFDLFVEALDLWQYMNDDGLEPNNIDEASMKWKMREGIHYAKKK